MKKSIFYVIFSYIHRFPHVQHMIHINHSFIIKLKKNIKNKKKMVFIYSIKKIKFDINSINKINI